MSRIVLGLGLLAALGSGGCGEQTKEDLAKVGAGLSQTWDAVKTFAVHRKDEALAFFRKVMSEAPETLENVRAEAEAVGADARQALDARWKDVERTFAAAQAATGEEWAKARDAFVAAYDAYSKQLDAHRSGAQPK